MRGFRNFKDNWTVGYTPDFVTGVWVGNNDNSAMHNITGVYGAGPIWHDIMLEIHRGKPEKSFPALKSQNQKKPSFSPAEKPLLRITKPFDLDVFQFKPNLPQDVQQIKFQIEKDISLGEATWFVNGEEAGKGDEIFWPLRQGEFGIKARVRDFQSEITRIFVE